MTTRSDIACNTFRGFFDASSGGGAGAGGAYGSSQGVRDLLGGLWGSVHVQPPSASEQLQILSAAHPALAGGPLLPAALAAAALVRRAAGQEPAGSLGASQVLCLSLASPSPDILL